LRKCEQITKATYLVTNSICCQCLQDNLKNFSLALITTSCRGVTVQSRSLSIISSELNTFSVAVGDEGERIGRDVCINGINGRGGKKKEREDR
jgi:hypothetical protein